MESTWSSIGQTDRSATLNINQKVVALSPQDATITTLDNMQTCEKFNDAEINYRRALALQSDLALTRNNLGVTLLELGKLRDARINYMQAILLKPNYSETPVIWEIL